MLCQQQQSRNNESCLAHISSASWWWLFFAWNTQRVWILFTKETKHDDDDCCYRCGRRGEKTIDALPCLLFDFLLPHTHTGTPTHACRYIVLIQFSSSVTLSTFKITITNHLLFSFSLFILFLFRWYEPPLDILQSSIFNIFATFHPHPHPHPHPHHYPSSSFTQSIGYAYESK